MLAVEALERAVLVYGWIGKIDAWLTSGSADDEAKARSIIGQLAHLTEGEVPVIRGIVATHLQAAQIVNLSQRSQRIDAEPHSYTPANDTAA